MTVQDQATQQGIILTDVAAAKVSSLLAQEGRDDLKLRVAVQPGGCSGLRYQLYFDEREIEGDVVRAFGGVQVVTDHLMTFPGSFAEVLMPDKLDKVALSFLVDDLEIRRGGVAANIAFGLGCLGLRPLLVGSAGPDFGDYRAWLTAHGVDTSAVRQSATRHTARFVSTTDSRGAHIGSFY